MKEVVTVCQLRGSDGSEVRNKLYYNGQEIVEEFEEFFKQNIGKVLYSCSYDMTPKKSIIRSIVYGYPLYLDRIEYSEEFGKKMEIYFTDRLDELPFEIEEDLKEVNLNKRSFKLSGSINRGGMYLSDSIEGNRLNYNMMVEEMLDTAFRDFKHNQKTLLSRLDNQIVGEINNPVYEYLKEL